MACWRSAGSELASETPGSNNAARQSSASRCSSPRLCRSTPPLGHLRPRGEGERGRSETSRASGRVGLLGGGRDSEGALQAGVLRIYACQRSAVRE